MNRRNDKWLYAEPTKIPKVMHIKFTSSYMVLGSGAIKDMSYYPTSSYMALGKDGHVDIRMLDTVVRF